MPVPRSRQMDGQIFTAPPACGPRICTHQPLVDNQSSFTILEAKENAALVHRYFRGPTFHLLDILKLRTGTVSGPYGRRPSTRGITRPM